MGFKFNDRVENLSVAKDHKNRFGVFVHGFKNHSLIAIKDPRPTGRLHKLVTVKTSNLKG